MRSLGRRSWAVSASRDGIMGLRNQCNSKIDRHPISEVTDKVCQVRCGRCSAHRGRPCASLLAEERLSQEKYCNLASSGRGQMRMDVVQSSLPSVYDGGNSLAWRASFVKSHSIIGTDKCSRHVRCTHCATIGTISIASSKFVFQ